LDAVVVVEEEEEEEDVVSEEVVTLCPLGSGVRGWVSGEIHT
jgi:hypothetical protein